METTKIGVLNCKLVFQEKCGENFKEITWHKGTVVEIHDVSENIYHKVERLHYQESERVKIYYNDKIRFSLIPKHRINVMDVNDIRWRLLVFESIGMRWYNIK